MSDIKPQKDSVESDFVLLKTSKLSSALYAVTDFLSDSDPLKWRLRESALDTLSHITMSDIKQSKRSIRQLLSFIDIALSGQFVSEMNFSILKQEYTELRQSLMRPGSLAPAVNLSLSSAAVPDPTTKFLSPAQPEDSLSAKSPGSRRQNAIFEFIKEQGREVSIGDLAKLMPGLSTKTIQRDLIELVSRGQLKKQGQKRWSRYFLA